MNILPWNTPDLLAPATHSALLELPANLIIGITENADELADTDIWAKTYGISLEETANVVVVETRKTRNAEREFAAVLVLASTRADLNGAIKKALGVSKVSFAPTDKAVEATGMESGGMSPIGLPSSWPLLIDSRVIAQDTLYIGSGIRPSKLVIKGELLTHIPGVEIQEGLAN